MPNPILAAVFVSPGVKTDGGGFYIDAQGHIHRIPPWDPQVRSELEVASSLVAAAGNLHNRELASEVTTVAQKIFASHAGAIQAAAGQAVKVGA